MRRAQTAKRSAQILSDVVAAADFAVGEGELVAEPEDVELAELVDNVPPWGASVGMTVVAVEAADMYAFNVSFAFYVSNRS
jgi:hypothetical protein